MTCRLWWTDIHGRPHSGFARLRRPRAALALSLRRRSPCDRMPVRVWACSPAVWMRGAASSIVSAAMAATTTLARRSSSQSTAQHQQLLQDVTVSRSPGWRPSNVSIQHRENISLAQDQPISINTSISCSLSRRRYFKAPLLTPSVHLCRPPSPVYESSSLP